MSVEIDEDSWDSVIDELLNNIANNVFYRSQNNIVDMGLVDESTLLGSGKIEPGDREVTIVYSAPHSSVMEFGRAVGGRMSPNFLTGWIRRKLGISDEKEIMRVAWAIAKSIEANGITPRPFLRQAREGVITEYNAKRMVL